MLSNTSLKFAGLALALIFAVGCQHQATEPSSQAKQSAKTSQQGSHEQDQQTSEQEEQVMITVHLAQLEQEPNLLTVDLGENKYLYALPQAVLTQMDIEKLTPVASRDGKTFIVFDLNPVGRAKLADMTKHAQGHFFLVSVQRQLIGVSKITEPVTDGKLVMATENDKHTQMILQLLR